jgi:hypothetical protein
MVMIKCLDLEKKKEKNKKLKAKCQVSKYQGTQQTVKYGTLYDR